MNAQELKDFQEKERQEKERLEKAEREKKEQQEKAQKDKEAYQKSEKEKIERAGKLADKDIAQKKAAQEEKHRDQKRAEKAYKPRSPEGKAREKMRKSPEHQAMREAIRDQVADRQQTAKDGTAGPQIVRNPEQQAEAAKYREMQQNDSKSALGAVGKAHGSPEMQGLNGTRDFEAQQAAAALRAQGDQKPWTKQVQQHDQPHDHQAKANEHGKDHTDPDPQRIAREGGPDRPGPAPAHAHHGHHMPWDKNPHQAKGGLSKEHGQDLGEKPWLRQQQQAKVVDRGPENDKPWQNQNRADPDQAESRMAQQSREREQERGR